MPEKRPCGRPRGEEPSYTAVHKRLRKERGTPSLCDHCGTTTAKKFEWAYAGAGHTSGAFSAVLDEYVRLCTSCHIKFDGHPSQGLKRSPETCAKMRASWAARRGLKEVMPHVDY